MTYQYELTICNDDLLVDIYSLNTDEDKNKHQKLNVNDLIKNSGIIEDKLLQQFNYFYNYIVNELKLKREFALKKVISSNLSFNRRIPLHYVKEFGDYSLYDDKEKIESQILNSINDDVVTLYYCNDRTDWVIACLYHFLKSEYSLKKCPQCNNWFLEKKKKIIYCSDSCNKKNKSIREMKRRENNPIVAMDKKIRDMLDSRNTDELYKYISDYKMYKEKYNDEELLNWLQQEHKNYLVRNKDGVNNE